MPSAPVDVPLVTLWRYFHEFVSNEKRAGGPDPHMATVIHMSSTESEDEKVWRGGCYAGTYNVPAAEAVWQAWPWPTVTEAKQADVVAWCAGVWPLATRRERRAVRTPEQMGRFLWEYGQWAMHGPDPEVVDYEEAWADVTSIYTVGRYIAMKLLEYFRRTFDAPWLMLPDMRPKGGWSPREGLALLYPGMAEPLLGDDRPEHLRLVNLLADEVMGMATQAGTPITRYETQVLLCDFKQAWNRRQYPGRSLDSELEYWVKMGTPATTRMFAARRALFPPEGLGELNGWWGVRKDLTDVMRDHGYVWSDANFVYPTDLANPVPR